MASATGQTAAELILYIQREVPVPESQKPSGRAVLRLLNDAVRDLAREAGAFRRWELFPAEASTAEYSLQQTPERILRVRYAGTRLEYRTVDALDTDEATRNWRTKSGTPRFWTGTERVRLTPIPSGDGAALTFSGSTKLTADEGYGITGHGYVLAFDAGSEVFFLPGDGTVSNEETASGRILVEYTYTPDPITTQTVIPFRFEQALKSFALYRLLAGESAQIQLGLYQNERAQLAVGVIDPVWEYRHYDAVQRAVAEGQAPPKLLAEDYERIVHAALRDGDVSGREYILSKQFLMAAVQQAVAEGKAVPKGVRDAYDRYVHNLASFGDRLQAALPWSYLQREIQRCLSLGVPVDEAVLSAYLVAEQVQTAGPEENSLRTEVPWG